MSTNINEIKTRISLRYDTFEKWQASKLILNAGEVGFCTIPSGSAEATTAPTVLFKVGDGTHKFSELKWASATASDVYGWAKKSTIEAVPVKIGSGDNVISKTIQQWMEIVRQNTADIASLDIPSDDDINGLISTALNKLAYTTPTTAATATATEFVSTVTQTDGKIAVTKAKVPTANASTAGVMTLGAAGGAAPYELVAKVSNIESAYLRYNNTDEKLYLGKDGTDEIIFDCGGVPI